jgi:aconitate hydratase
MEGYRPSLGELLASPRLVVAYAIAGTVDMDLDTTVGVDPNGKRYIWDIWPTAKELRTR